MLKCYSSSTPLTLIALNPCYSDSLHYIWRVAIRIPLLECFKMLGESNWHPNLFWSPTCVVNIRVFTAPVCTITSVWFTLRLVQSATQIIVRTYLSDQDYTAVLWVQVQQHSWRHKSSPTLPAPPSIIQAKQHLPTYSFLGTDRHPKRRIISSLSFSGSLTISEREVRAVFVNH